MNGPDVKKIGDELRDVIETHSRFHVLATDKVGFGYSLLITDIERNETVKLEIRPPL